MPSQLYKKAFYSHSYTGAIILALLFLMAGTTGCKKFLEQEPYNRLSNDDVFKDLEGARTTLVGCYDNLKDANYYLRSMAVYADLTGGNIRYGRSTSLPMENTYNLANTSLSTQNDLTGFYQIAYNTIFRANNIFEYIGRVEDANQLQKNRMLAEAYTFRALCHFDLVRVFAQPYNFTPDGSHVGINYRRANVDGTLPVAEPNTVKQVYDNLVLDLDSALVLYANSVPIYASGLEKSYFGLQSAKALLARVLLYRGDWMRVQTLCNELIATNSYLVPNSQYVQSWRRKGGNQMDNEGLFLLAARTDVNQGSVGDNFNAANNVFGVFAASNDLLRLFAPGDVRSGNSMFVAKTTSGISSLYTLKFQGMNDSADNQKLLRNSEVYLNRAEAAAETDNFTLALSDLNRIRQRANPATPPLNISVKAELLDSILVERRRELCFEGHQLFDLSRKKKNLLRTDCSGSNCSVLYPSPLFVVPRPTQR